MSIERVTVDREALPEALLPLIKAHVRVEFDRDDMLLTTYTAAAIGLVESKCNVSINPAQYVVTADELRASGTRWAYPGGSARWTLPLNNVRDFTLMESTEEDAADLSGDFELWSPDFGGSASSYLIAVAGRPVPTAAIVSLDVGLDDSVDLAPGFFALIARLAGSMYENREASTALWADTFAEELNALWRPAA
jgi:hypothetical protein